MLDSKTTIIFVKSKYRYYQYFFLDRLVMYIERDSRKNTANRSDNCMNMEYLTQCLEWFLAALVEIIPSITSKCGIVKKLILKNSTDVFTLNIFYFICYGIPVVSLPQRK